MLTDEQVEQLEALREKYPGNRMEKFAVNPREYEAIAIEVARGLRLDERPAKVLLDLGCGLGFFLHACKDFGHVVVGMDLANPIIAAAASIMHVPIVKRTLVAYEPLPHGLVYDFVTMFGVNLHDGKYWDAEKYAFLAADIRSRLRTGGAWVIRPNAPVIPNGPLANQMDPEWWQKVAGLDAEISTTINHSFQVTVKWKP